MLRRAGGRGVRSISGPPCSLECVSSMGRDGGAPGEAGWLGEVWISKSGPRTGSVALGQSSQDTHTHPIPSHSRELAGSVVPAVSTARFGPSLLTTG